LSSMSAGLMVTTAASTARNGAGFSRVLRNG
jgi:hypothetical protein